MKIKKVQTKNKMRFLDNTYYRDGKTVVCRTNVDPLFRDSALKQLGILLDIKVPSFIGKAVCHEGDEFNAIRGERIAESKAKRKAYEWTRKRLKTAIEDREYYLNLLKGYYNQMETLVARETKHIEKLSNE